MPWIEREGVFRAKPIDHGTVRAESGAEQFNIRFEITESWNREESRWESWSECDAHHCSASCNLIKKSGAINEITVRQLQEAFGWSGDLRLLNAEWDMPECQIVVKAEIYDNKTRYKADQINHRDADPDAVRGMKKDDPATATQRLSQHASAMRALVGFGPKSAKAPPVPSGSPETNATPDTTQRPPFDPNRVRSNPTPPVDSEMPPPIEPGVPVDDGVIPF